MQGLWKRFAADRRGAVTLLVGVGAAVLAGFAGLATDAARGYLIKSRLSQALDLAALAGARNMNSPDRDDDIRMFFNANFPEGFLGAELQGASAPTITPGADNKTIALSATATVPTMIMRVVGINTMTVAASTEVTIELKNLEVALVLDVTGSMSGQKIIDLRDAANELVDIVVQDVQTPYYSKVGIVPYSMAVNVGAYAQDVRGPINNTTKAITNATRTNPLKITSNNHGFVNNDKIFITGVSGMTQLNNKPYLVANANVNDFTLKTLAGANINGTSGYSSYTSGGSIHCAWDGCQYNAFLPASGSIVRTHQVSTCVSERTGADAFTDAAPSTSLVGRNYPNTPGSTPGPNTPNPCLTNTISPLTSDKTSLHTAVNALAAGGSTGGHIGVAWGWYLVSPNFGYLFPAASQPAAYGAEDLMKVVVLMTDGEYNSVYCKGVIAADSTNGSGNDRDHINCNAPNGSSYTQAQTLCDNMRTAGVIVYTVGLQVINTPAAQNLVTNCAKDPTYVYLPQTGTELKDAFRDIAGRVSQLRVSK